MVQSDVTRWKGAQHTLRTVIENLNIVPYENYVEVTVLELLKNERKMWECHA